MQRTVIIIMVIIDIAVITMMMTEIINISIIIITFIYHDCFPHSVQCLPLLYSVK